MKAEVTTNSLLGKIKEDLADKTESFVFDKEKVEEKTEMLKVILEKEKEAEDNMDYITAKYYLDQYYFHIINTDDIYIGDYLKQASENLVDNNFHDLSEQQRKEKVSYILDQQKNVKKLILIMEILGFSDRRQINVNIIDNYKPQIILLQMVFANEIGRAICIELEHEKNKSFDIDFGVLDNNARFIGFGNIFFGNKDLLKDNTIGLEGVEHLLDIDMRKEIDDRLLSVNEFVERNHK